MNNTPIKILYETSPEKVERLLKRLAPLAAAIQIRETADTMYLEASFDDIFFSNAFSADFNGREEKEQVHSAGASCDSSFCQEVSDEFKQGAI